MNATKTLELVKELKPKLGERATTKLLDFVENQNGELATKQDLHNLEQKIEHKIKHEIDGIKHEIDGVKRDVFWLKWIVGLGFTIGFGALLTIMLYLHSDTKAKMNELRADIKENQKLILQLIQKK